MLTLSNSLRALELVVDNVLASHWPTSMHLSRRKGTFLHSPAASLLPLGQPADSYEAVKIRNESGMDTDRYLGLRLLYLNKAFVCGI